MRRTTTFVFLLFLSGVTALGQYPRLPTFEELTTEQKRLLATLNQAETSAYWESLNEDARATFFQVTYVIQHTPFYGRSLIEHISAIEPILENDDGILEGDRVTHTHSNRLTATVDGWRLHLELDDSVTVDRLLRACFGVCSDSTTGCSCREDRNLSSTHEAFGFNHSIRDYREEKRYDGPFLQIVLNTDASEADFDIDKGRRILVLAVNFPIPARTEHLSSPKDVYENFRERFGETESIYKVLVP